MNTKLLEAIKLFDELFPNITIKTIHSDAAGLLINEKESVFYEVGEGNITVAKQKHTISNNIYNDFGEDLPNVTVLPAGVLSLGKKPKGTFDLVITQEDYDKAEDGYWNDDCPLGQAVKRSFPNIDKFKTYEDGIGNNKDETIANIYPAFEESDYISFNKEFKTTITFL